MMQKTLRAYLSAYVQALKNQSFRRHYIDAFAGTGIGAGERQEAQAVLEIPELDAMTKDRLGWHSKSLSVTRDRAQLLRRA